MSSDASKHVFPAFCLAFAGAIAILSGCPGTLDDEARYRAALDGSTQPFVCGNVHETIIKPRCTTAGCHNVEKDPAACLADPPPEPPPDDCNLSGLDLESPDPLGRLANAKPARGLGVIVDPKTPEASVIYKRVTSTKVSERMPSGADKPLPAGEIACILEWLKTAEAPSDGGTTEGGTGDTGTKTDSGAARDSAKTDTASGG